MSGVMAVFDLNVQVMRLLAVAGGGALGYLLVGGLLRGLGRFVFRNKLPRLAHVSVRLLGGLAGALLVWFWLSGVGGGGPGGGSGWWPFGGSGTGGGVAEVRPEAPAPPSKAPETRGEAVEVEMLGGSAVREQRFYRLVGANGVLQFEELKERILELRQKNPAVAVLRIIVRQDSVAEDSGAVTQLEKWARSNGLTTEVAKP